MKSQKKSSQPQCIKCAVMLTAENWPIYLKPRSNYICLTCYRIQNKVRQNRDPLFNKKQKDRYRMRRSAVIQSYGDCCKYCGEDRYEFLTIDHINGGNKHEKEMNYNNMIDYLYNNKINLDGYQVLCYNCNYSKNYTGKDKHYAKDKASAIKNYGGWCQECKEDRIERLTIDHIKNDGAEQRKKLNYGTGAKFYRYLKKNGYPNLGLQVICYNCNCARFISCEDKIKF